MLRLELEDQAAIFRPGAELRGLLSWDTSESPGMRIQRRWLSSGGGWPTLAVCRSSNGVCREARSALKASCYVFAGGWNAPLPKPGKLLESKSSSALPDNRSPITIFDTGSCSSPLKLPESRLER